MGFIIPNGAKLIAPVNPPGLRAAAFRLPAFALVTASTGFGCCYAWQQGTQNGIALAGLSALMALGLEVSKPISLAAAVSRGTPWPSRIALGLLALVSVAYSLSAEVSLVAVNRQVANAGRASVATAHAAAQSDLARAQADLAALGTVPTIADAERAVTADKLDPAFARTSACSNATLPASKAFCAKVAQDTASLANARDANVLRGKIETAETALIASAGVVDADPGSAAVAVYAEALGVKVDPATVAKVLVLLAVLALEVGSATAGLLMTAGFNDAPATHTNPSAPESNPVAEPGSNRPLVPAEHAPEGGLSALNEPDSAGQSVRERLIGRLRVAGGGLAQTTREIALGLGCSKSALGEVLAKLESEGVIVRVAASHGKGSAIRLADTAAA